MSRFFALLVLSFSLSIIGCSSSDTSNVVKDADQEAIDAYNAAIAEGEAETSNDG